MLSSSSASGRAAAAGAAAPAARGMLQQQPAARSSSTWAPTVAARPSPPPQQQQQQQRRPRTAPPAAVYDVARSTNIKWHEGGVPREAKEALLGQRGAVIWFTGLSGSGKSTLASTLEHALHGMGHATMLLDGDNVRHGLNSDLGFSAADREENIRRVGEVAKLAADSGVIALVSFISPYRRDRDRARALLPPGRFIEVFMATPIELCEQRDPKGLYAKARAGKIKGFTGIDDPYEEPEAAEAVLQATGPDGAPLRPEDHAAQLLEALAAWGLLQGPPAAAKEGAEAPVPAPAEAPRGAGAGTHSAR